MVLLLGNVIFLQTDTLNLVWPRKALHTMIPIPLRRNRSDSEKLLETDKDVRNPTNDTKSRIVRDHTVLAILPRWS